MGKMLASAVVGAAWLVMVLGTSVWMVLVLMGELSWSLNEVPCGMLKLGGTEGPD